MSNLVAEGVTAVVVLTFIAQTIRISVPYALGAMGAIGAVFLEPPRVSMKMINKNA